MKIFKFLIFNFLIIFFINNFAFSQELGSTLLTNYTTNEYNAHIQNWSVVKDNRGVMYFANYTCILEYDGTNWRKIYTENNTAVRALSIDDYGTIYVGCEGSFGYLAPNSVGKMQYNSISSKYDTTIIKSPPIIWRTRVVNNEVYFNALNVLYRYSPYKTDAKSDIEKIKVWYPKVGFYIGFSIFNKFYIVEKSSGLLEMKNDSLVLAKNGEQFIKKAIFSMEPASLENNSNEMIITLKGKLLKYFPDKDTTNQVSAISEFNTQIDSVFEIKDNYCCVTLPGKKYAVGTISNGVIIIDSLGNICDYISKQNGLTDNTIWNLNYYDRCLWITMNNGISKSEVISPFRIWNENNALEGAITSLLKFNNNIYVTTNSMGVSYLKVSKFNGIIPAFEKIKTISEAWELFNYKNIKTKTNVLLIGLYSNLLELDKENTMKSIINKSIYDFEQSKINNDYIYAGGENLYVLKRNHQNKSWETNKIYTFTSNITSIAEDSLDLWVTTKLNGIYRIRVKSLDDYFLTTDEKPEFEIQNFDTSTVGLKDNLSIKAYNYNNQLIFSSVKGLFIFNENDNSFYKTEQYGKNYSADSDGTQYLFQNNDGDFLLGITGILYKQKNDEYILDSMYYKRQPLKGLSAFYPDSNKIWYAGGSDGILQYNPKFDYDYEADFKTLIRKVIINTDSLVFYGTNFIFNKISGVYIASLEQSDELKPKIAFNYNTLYFEFAAPFFIEESKTKYSYQLENFDDKWSEWSSKTEKEYTNLHEGKYKFKVKAKNIFGKESTIAIYEFTILPPWYRTLLAYFIYLIILVLLIYVFIKIYTRRLKLQNIKLENTVYERTLEIQLKNTELEQQKEEIQAQTDNLIEINNQLFQQKEEIQTQADQLDKYNKELEKLSIVASQTHNAIMILDKNGNFEWINYGYTRMFGYTFDELINRFGNNILGEKTEKWVSDLINNCIENKKTVEYETRILTKSNEYIWIHATLTPILDGYGEISKLVIIDSDIRKLKQAETEIQKQRDILHFQNEQITSSIRYGETIQKAILPLDSQIAENFEHFVLYKPKDIVSGDFYLFISNIVDGIEYFFVATVDCTGHGVPGAFMSMIASRIINEIIKEKNIISPKQILSVLNESIIKALKQEHTFSNDGMDLCLCRIQKTENNTAEIIFTGAKRPLHYYKTSEKEIQTLKADRLSIGGRKNMMEFVQFTNQELVFDKGDIIYLCTDGLTDQNNEERKKFGTSNFLRILKANITQSMDIQKQKLEIQLENWMNNCEQRDDITVLGLKI